MRVSEILWWITLSRRAWRYDDGIIPRRERRAKLSSRRLNEDDRTILQVESPQLSLNLTKMMNSIGIVHWSMVVHTECCYESLLGLHESASVQEDRAFVAVSLRWHLSWTAIEQETTSLDEKVVYNELLSARRIVWSMQEVGVVVLLSWFVHSTFSVYLCVVFLLRLSIASHESVSHRVDVVFVRCISSTTPVLPSFSPLEEIQPYRKDWMYTLNLRFGCAFCSVAADDLEAPRWTTVRSFGKTDIYFDPVLLDACSLFLAGLERAVFSPLTRPRHRIAVACSPFSLLDFSWLAFWWPPDQFAMIPVWSDLREVENESWTIDQRVTHLRLNGCELVHADALVSNVVHRSASMAALSNHDALPKHWHCAPLLADYSRENNFLLLRRNCFKHFRFTWSLTRDHFGHFACRWWLKRSLVEVIVQYDIIVVMTYTWTWWMSKYVVQFGGEWVRRSRMWWQYRRSLMITGRIMKIM